MVSYVMLSGVVIFILVYALREAHFRYRRLRVRNEVFMEQLERDSGACLYIYSKPALRNVVEEINKELELEPGR